MTRIYPSVRINRDPVPPVNHGAEMGGFVRWIMRLLGVC